MKRLLLLLLPLMFTVSCVSTATHQKAVDELGLKLSDAQEHCQMSIEEKDTLAAEQKEILAQLRAEVERGEVIIETEQTKTHIHLQGAALFASGSTELTENTKLLVKKIMTTLAPGKSKYFVVEGYTDSTPIGPSLKPIYRSNLELSSARAAQVAEYMQEELGITKPLIIMGFGKKFPRQAEHNENAKKLNRRVTITASLRFEKPF